MSAPYPSLTSTYHTTSYPSISPSRPELSTKGKTVAVTGGAAGIGAHISRAFAESGSTQIAILGRREQKLRAHAQVLEKDFPGLKVLTCTADVSSASDIDRAFANIKSAFGTVDIFVSNAGVGATNETVAGSDVDAWWNAVTSNLKGSFLSARYFLAQAPKEGAVLINLTTGIAHIPPMFPGASSYAAAKAGALKLFEYAASENPEIGVYSVHPGIVESDMNAKSGVPPQDDASLVAHHCVWLSSKDAKFLTGKTVWAHWDVDELLARKNEISGWSEGLTLGLKKLDLEGFQLPNPEEATK
ncbi:NAD(P)-binding protein [Lophiostoma macrostomum CBS 122681]|uniref:NAD(P)-binding protein n=1 Tax=Lophiostoma macrostomum CBS 122681 TaxID=1314788 RepID=A0A6A6T9T2_9PLEO|nr:NAD(P)-binding protein [Lophiostoma macrostomum CBS 122681]